MEQKSCTAVFYVSAFLENDFTFPGGGPRGIEKTGGSSERIND